MMIHVSVYHFNHNHSNGNDARDHGAEGDGLTQHQVLAVDFRVSCMFMSITWDPVLFKESGFYTRML